MRILHVADSYLPTLGGIELHVRDLVARQRATGHDVVVATRTGSEVVDDVRRVGGGQRSWLADAKPDLVHAHVSIVSPFALTAARHASLGGVPTVITVHSLWTHVGPLPELARELWGMRRWDVTWTAVSRRAANPVSAVLGVPVHVVPNAVDLAEWTPDMVCPPPGPPHVVSVMRLTRLKRALPLVRTLRRATERHDLTATIVGDGPERAAMQRYLRRHRLTDRVRLTGALGRPEIRRLLATAAVFVAPSHRESFGIAALEARASGVPVVASSQSGVSTFIEHERDGLLGPDDRRLGDQLIRLLREPDLRDELSRHNRRVPPAYGWDHALERNEAIYTLAIASHGRTRIHRGQPRRVLIG